MKARLLNLLAMVTSLFGYLEWGRGSSTFLYRAEGDILLALLHQSAAAIHPFTIIPLLGQLLLAVTVLQPRPSRWLTYAGLAGIGLLLVFLFAIGLLARNYRISLSAVPFIVTAILSIRAARPGSAQ